MSFVLMSFVLMSFVLMSSVLMSSIQFNVTIEDDSQVVNTLKRSLEGRLPQQDCPVSVEIAMETLEVRC